jgi:integrase/recombinase XerD
MVGRRTATPVATPFTFAPDITIFVRHSSDCPHKEDENYRLCRCRKHLRWSHGRQQHRISAKTRSWSEAEKVKKQIEAQFGVNLDGTPVGPADPVVNGPGSRNTIKRAIEVFLASKRNQGLNEGVTKKYQRELERLQNFLGQRSKFFPNEIGLADLEEFRSEWEQVYPSSTTRQKVQERLRGFLRYCYEAKWIERVPRLSPIKVDEPPTLPLSEKEYEKLLKKIPDEFADSDKARKVRALVQLMRHSGLAIRDAVTLERDEIQRDSKKKIYRIVTNRQKTGTHVSVPIPDDVASEVLAVLNGNARYVFWNSGNGKETTAVTNWQHHLRRLFRAAGFPEGHPHQLRDTFAVDLLQKGVPLEEVSKLLGHESIKTTEKSYAKWVQARQDRLDSLVIATWNQ